MASSPPGAAVCSTGARRRRCAAAHRRWPPAAAALLAEHLTRAEAWPAALAQWQQAAEQAQRTHAHEVALQHVERALALLPRLPDPEAARLALLQRRLDLLRILVRIPDWAAQAAELLALAERAGAVDAQLAALEAQMSLHVLQSRFAAVEEVGRRALALAAAAGRPAAAARLHHTLGWHLADALGRSREGLAHLETARQLADTAGDRALRYQVLCSLAFARRAEGRCAAALAAAQEALVLAGGRPDAPPQPAGADALRELAEANAYLGRWEEAWRQLRALDELYETLREPWAHGAVLFNLGYYSANMGQFDAAVDAMRRLVVLSEQVGLPADSDYGIWHRAGLARVLLAARAVEEAGALLAGLDTSALQPGRPYLAWARAVAEYHALRGAPADGLARLQPAVAWWRGAASLHDADILLQLALLHHALEQVEPAAAAVEEATAFLAPTDIHRYRVRLCAARWRILGAADDLTAAREVLAAQAAAFTNEGLRRAFLEKVPLHREIAA